MEEEQAFEHQNALMLKRGVRKMSLLHAGRAKRRLEEKGEPQSVRSSCRSKENKEWPEERIRKGATNWKEKTARALIKGSPTRNPLIERGRYRLTVGSS